MKETTKFLRLMIPVFSLLSILALLFLFSDDGNVIEKINKLDDNSKFVGLILTSGGLGFLLNQIYFFFYYSWPFRRILDVGHKKFLLKKEHLFLIINIDGNFLRISDLSDRQCWELVSQFTLSERNKFRKLSGIDDYNSYLVDIQHSLGVMILGMIIVLFIWICTNRFCLCDISINIIIGFVIWSFIFIVLFLTYWRILQSKKNINYAILSEVIDEIYRKTWRKIKLICNTI